MSDAPTWRLRHEAKPVTMNASRRGGGDHWSQRSKVTAEWREAYGWLTRGASVPRLAWMTVTVVHYAHRGPLPDIGACMPSVKAAIDGIVDAGIVPDDSPEYLQGILFLPPQRAKAPALELILAGEVAVDQPTLDDVFEPAPPARPKLRLVTSQEIPHE